jgi:predicted Zn-dependent protease
LAALLAHEASHINEQHSLRTLSRELALYVLLASLTGDAGGFSAVILENSNMISSLSYSRKFEKEADLEGVELLLKSNINPNGMITLFQKFENRQDSLENKLRNKLSADTSLALEVAQDTTEQTWDEEWIEDITDILSTHPSPKNRIKYLKQKTQNLKESNYIYQERLKELFLELKEGEE